MPWVLEPLPTKLGARNYDDVGDSLSIDHDVVLHGKKQRNAYLCSDSDPRPRNSVGW
jgi:hypothetical protein